ncbi:MAG: glycosyltransferase, partial [Chloroflexota bacterium]|nr:glycosyltransferase [Chloroflexota bacterium]
MSPEVNIRVGAAGILATGTGVAWAATRSPRVARAMGLWTLASVAYTAVLALRGGALMRRMSDESRGFGNNPLRDVDDVPFVTLMVPARDEAQVIADIVRDLARQRYARGGRAQFEVIVIDDGSTDGTGDIARAAARGALGDVRIVERPNGTGPALRGAALN